MKKLEYLQRGSFLNVSITLERRRGGLGEEKIRNKCFLLIMSILYFEPEAR